MQPGENYKIGLIAKDIFDAYGSSTVQSPTTSKPADATATNSSVPGPAVPIVPLKTTLPAEPVANAATVTPAAADNEGLLWVGLAVVAVALVTGGRKVTGPGKTTWLPLAVAGGVGLLLLANKKTPLDPQVTTKDAGVVVVDFPGSGTNNGPYV